ncbi:MAG: hypothetical protein ACP5SI_05500 [Chloroflexia bacterium]
MSRVLPNAMVARAFRELGVRSERLESDLPRMVDVGRQMLYGFQHEDGGWGWWYDDRSHDYQTAYILYGLAMTKQGGFEVDEGVLERGARYLQEHLPGMDRRTRAYALYALTTAGFGDLDSALRLAAERDDPPAPLDPFSRAALALTLHALGDEATARRLIEEIAATAVVSADRAYWDTGIGDGEYQAKTMASSVRSTALVLDALVQLAPDHPLVLPTVRWLMAQRRGYAWNSTQETSYALLALADYVRSAGEQFAQRNWRVDLNGEEAEAGSFTSVDQAVRVTVPTERLRGGENRLRLLHSGSGRLYYTVIARFYLPEEVQRPAGAIRVSRVYRRPGGQPLDAPLRVGELVEVALTVEVPEDAHYVILYDPLPAGLEGLNQRLATTSYVARETWEERSIPVLPYSRKDVLDRAVVLFFNRLGRGSHTFTYLARATVPGDFHVLPTEAYLMYQPEVWGRAAGETIAVRP